MYVVVAIERSGFPAMGTAGLLQVHENLFEFPCVAHKLNLLHRKISVNIPRNAPCPCGSGNKYKKCCLAQDEKAAADARRQAQEADAAPVKCLTELDALSNKANDLIRSEQWVAAEQCCRQLQEQFPDETDGDERFSQYYKQKADFVQSQAHAQAALQKAEQHPDKFDPELVADLKEEIAYLDECIQAGCLVD